MKILIQTIDGGGNSISKLGWANALSYAGHQVVLWNEERVPAFDIFDFEPDLFLGATYHTSRAIAKNIILRPNMKIAMWCSDYGPKIKEIDLNKFPILVAQQQEIDLLSELKQLNGKPDLLFAHYPSNYISQHLGYWKDLGFKTISMCNACDAISYRPGNGQLEYETDISFIGGCWDYKRKTIFPYLFPLFYPIGQYNIKIYGYQKWSCPQYIGMVDREQERDIFASSKICPNISEPHSQKYGNDLVERPFKVMGTGQALCISDYVEGFKDLLGDNLLMAKSPEEFKLKIDHFLKKENRQERQDLIDKGYKAVMRGHTYFHRFADLFTHLELFDEAVNMIKSYKNLLKRQEREYLLDGAV